MYRKNKINSLRKTALFLLSITASSTFSSPMGFVETIRENDPGTGGGDNPGRIFYFPSGI